MSNGAAAKPAMIVHGGAWDMPGAVFEVHRLGCVAALDAGRAVLDRGGSALDAVEAAVRLLEDDPTFDAGRGSFLTRWTPGSWTARRSTSARSRRCATCATRSRSRGACSNPSTA
jgi:hypothetical protein